jgi:hypothetical protein
MDPIHAHRVLEGRIRRRLELKLRFATALAMLDASQAQGNLPAWYACQESFPTSQSRESVKVAQLAAQAGMSETVQLGVKLVLENTFRIQQGKQRVKLVQPA